MVRSGSGWRGGAVCLEKVAQMMVCRYHHQLDIPSMPDLSRVLCVKTLAGNLKGLFEGTAFLLPVVDHLQGSDD